MSEHYISRFEHFITETLAHYHVPATRMKEALHYALIPGGKRLRALLVYTIGDLIGVELPVLDCIALSIESIHSYSLVHDDLPAMDNDDFRRGRLTCHKAFDEATAILVGDALQSFALDRLLNQLPYHLPSDQVLKICKELVEASGAQGMVSGQSLDITELSKANLTEETLREIHSLKTGKLFLACINMVLLAGTPLETEANALRAFASHIGLVFQMQDDFLDHYHSSEHGKLRASDKANFKNTFATLYPKDKLYQSIGLLFKRSREVLSLFEHRADPLIYLTLKMEQLTLREEKNLLS